MTTDNAQLKLPTRDELLVDPDSLPSPPVIALEILRKLSDPDKLDMRELGNLVSQDVRLTTAIIRNANSAATGGSRKVTSIDLALNMLGARGLRLLVISTSMSTLMPTNPECLDFMTTARQRTLICATLSRTFAEEINDEVADEAFLAGLLGSLGHLILHSNAPDVHQSLMEKGSGWPVASDEYTVLGYSADEVTAELLRSWGMPEILAEAIELRDALHSKVEPENADDDLVVALRLGLMAEKVLCGADSGQALFAMLEEARGVLGLDLVTLSDILVDAEPRVMEVAASVEFEAPAGAHEELLREATEAMKSLPEVA